MHRKTTMSNDENTLVAVSSPAIRTIIPRENEVSCVPDTVLTQETPESTDTKVKFPKRIKHRGRVFATIYGHRNYIHPKGMRVTISGHPRDDALPYQERQERRRIEESQK